MAAEQPLIDDLARITTRVGDLAKAFMQSEESCLRLEENLAQMRDEAERIEHFEDVLLNFRSGVITADELFDQTVGRA